MSESQVMDGLPSGGSHYLLFYHEIGRRRAMGNPALVVGKSQLSQDFLLALKGVHFVSLIRNSMSYVRYRTCM